MKEAGCLALTSKEIYKQRRIAHIQLYPNLITKDKFLRWVDERRYSGVTSICLTNIVLDIRNFKNLRRLSINLEMSKKLRKSIVPSVATDCIVHLINWPVLESLSLDSLTGLPDLRAAVQLKELFLAFRTDAREHPIRNLNFICGSRKLRSIQLANCTLGHATAF